MTKKGNSIKTVWRQYWANKDFKKRFCIAVFALLIVLILYPFFFMYLEQRKGIQLNDLFLPYLPVKDLSLAIFICIWLNVLLFISTIAKQPQTALLFLWGYLIMNILRIITMYAVPLEPPKDLIVLMDPISNHFYGKTFITKDLFFSGHTSTMFLLSFCFTNKALKYFSLLITMAVAIMVLIQRVHYSIDVIAALPFSYFAYKLALLVQKKSF